MNHSKSKQPTSQWPYRIGCPVWSCEEWRGSVYPTTAKKSDWLRYYSMAFNTVEGNSTFYGQPTHGTVRRWAEQTTSDFRFALKFPREISHEKQLIDVDDALDDFLQSLTILKGANRLGPAMLQLPPSFSARQFGQLDRFLGRLPRDLPFSVEVRHLDFFEGPAADELDGRLGEQAIDRVIFDSRPLFSAPPTEDAERDSQRRKPHLPVRKIATGKSPILRFIGRNNPSEAQPWIDEWTPTVGKWIQAGRTPYIFTHTPDDVQAPVFARLFHASLSAHVTGLPPLPDWPGEAEVKQRTLFS